MVDNGSVHACNQQSLEESLELDFDLDVDTEDTREINNWQPVCPELGIFQPAAEMETSSLYRDNEAMTQSALISHEAAEFAKLDENRDCHCSFVSK